MQHEPTCTDGNDALHHAALRELETNGFVVLKDVLSQSEVALLATDLEPWFARTPMCEGDFYGWLTKRVGGLLDKAPLTQAMALNPRILALVGAVLGGQADCIQLNLTQATRVHGGEEQQAPHRDEEMWPAGKGGAQWLVNVMWAVDDFTPDNGATLLWPGSHRAALDRTIDPAASMPASMRRGSALIFLGSLTHAAGANSTNAPRTGIIISYCLGWLKQYENQFLAYSPDVARLFPGDLQRLIGYRMHRPNLGGVDGQDPILTLHAPGVVRPHKDALTPEIARELAALYPGRIRPASFTHGE